MFHLSKTSKVAVPDVVVGRITVEDSNEAVPHVIARVAVPVIETASISQLLGVPDRLVVKEVISVDWAVSEYTSTLSVLIVGFAEVVVVPMRLVIRLLVSV